MKVLKQIKKLYNKLVPHIPREYRMEYAFHRFRVNNYRIFIMSLFLFLEQMVYGLVISEPGSSLFEIYLFSAFIMLLMSLISGYFHLRRPVEISFVHKFYEMSLGMFGMGIALIRFLFLEFDVFRIPTIYIAVLYGVAVIFFFPFWQSFILYTLLSATIILLIPQFHFEAEATHYIADIGSNGLIAWLISAINYRSFVNDFLNKREVENANRALREMSIRDELTGLYNRRKINDVLADTTARAERYSFNFAVMIVDIDFFKKVNDSYGHQAGDGVLKEFSEIFMKNIREVDTCGRWGGEEFIIVCPQTDIAHGARLADRLRQLIESHQFRGGYAITASFGVATYREHRGLNPLLKAADIRLYKAKMNGRNQVVAECDGDTDVSKAATALGNEENTGEAQE